MPPAKRKGVRPITYSNGIYATDEDRVEDGREDAAEETEEAVDPAASRDSANNGPTDNAEANQPDLVDWCDNEPD